MASTTINGITLTYPDGPCPVFNPCIFLLTGTMARAKAQVVKDGVSYHATYQLPNGGRLDLRQYLQMMFDGIGFGKELDSMGNFKVSEFGVVNCFQICIFVSDNTTLISSAKLSGLSSPRRNWSFPPAIATYSMFIITTTARKYALNRSRSMTLLLLVERSYTISPLSPPHSLIRPLRCSRAS